MKDFFNSDYKEQELAFQKRAAKAKGNIDEKNKDLPSLGEQKIVIGNDFNVNLVDGDDNAGVYEGKGNEGGEGGDSQGREGGKLEKTDLDSKYKGKDRQTKKRKSGGGFNIDFDNLGVDSYRAKYEDDIRTIVINLDHPFLKKIEEMTGGDRNSTKYMRPAWEAAAFEYAYATTTQKRDSGHVEDDSDAVLIEMTKRVDALLRKMTALKIFDD